MPKYAEISLLATYLELSKKRKFFGLSAKSAFFDPKQTHFWAATILQQENIFYFGLFYSIDIPSNCR